LAARKRIVNRKAAYFGSYGWSGGARKEFAKLAESLQWEVVDTFEFLGSPTEEDLRKGEEFGARFGGLVKSI
jgi:anaerobic nitric oxide reductase flavorubredoxin